MRGVENQDLTPVSSGVDGCVDLRFERCGARTVLRRSRAAAPMALVRPFDLPDGRTMVQLITLGPGLCAGDAVHIDITAETGARVIVTTTAATRVMAMDASERAEQHVRLHAARDASLEYYPAVTIPFPGSALRQSLAVTASSSARVAVVETWALGRSAREEYLQFRSISSRTTLTVDDALIYADAVEFQPAAADLAGAGILSGHRYVAAGFWHGATLPDDCDPCNEGDALVAFAQSAPHLVYLRALGRSAPAMDEVLRRTTAAIAAHWRIPPIRFDRFRC
ncbi:MAG TPA: urease accessory protein UreD [Vicinamibacterales bacterium]|nr:urease accessory protein UreD [Vicinamibacterales bacterium]